MVKITDGLPWPIKAALQTFLYILQLFEVCLLACRKLNLTCSDGGGQNCQDVRPKITALLFAIQTLWSVVGQVSPEVVADSHDLRLHLLGFFELVLALGKMCTRVLNPSRTLQRIAIRLHTVLLTSQVKRAMAIHSVSACLVLEESRLKDARNTISVCYS